MARTVDTSVPVVLVQGISDALNHAVLAAARSLGRLGVDVFAVSSAARQWAAGRSRYVRRCVALDVAEATPDQLRSAVDTLVGRSAKVVLLPVDDVAALVVEDAPELRARALAPPRAPELVRKLTDKRTLYTLVGLLGIRAPLSRSVRSEDELLDASHVVGFPSVLKAAEPLALRRNGRGRSVTVARSLDALVRAYRCMGADVQATALLQQHIEGGEAGDWIFNGSFAAGGECRFHGTGVKLRQWPPGTGAATLGVSVPNPVVRDLSLRLARAVAFAGVIDIDFRFDALDGHYKLLDVNPRIGSSFRLFVSSSGIDIPRAHYFQITGQPLEAEEARAGRKWIVETRDLRSSLELLGHGGLRLRAWLRSVAGVDETAWFDLHDVRPFAAMLTHYASRVVRRTGGA